MLPPPLAEAASDPAPSAEPDTEAALRLPTPAGRGMADAEQAPPPQEEEVPAEQPSADAGESSAPAAAEETAPAAEEAAEEAPAAAAAEEAAKPAEDDGDDEDLDLDDSDDDGAAAAAPTEEGAAATPAAAAADEDDSDDDAPAVRRKMTKKKKSRFIEDVASESDDEGGTAKGEDEEEEVGENQYKLDDFVVEEDEETARKKAAAAAGDDDLDLDESEEEVDEETLKNRKRKQAEREELEAEDMVNELKELARDKNIEIATHQKKKRLKGRTAGTGADADLEEELDGVIEKDQGAAEEEDLMDEEEANMSIQAEYRDEAAGMFDMSEYDNFNDIGGEAEDTEAAEEADDDDDDEVDAKYKHIDKTDLADNFMTKTDKEIEFADIPERLNIHMRTQRRPLIGGEPLTQDELEEEAQWILARAFDPRQRDLPDVSIIANVLKHSLVDREDAPHIHRYRKESIMDSTGRLMLNEADIWKILKWDIRWDHFAHRQNMLLANAAKLGDELHEDYLSMLQEAQKDEHLTDMENFLKLQLQMAGPPTESTKQQPKGAVAKAQAAGLGKFVEQFGLTAFEFGNNVSLEMKKHDVMDNEKAPEDLAADFVSDSYPDADSVLRGSCNMLARQIAEEPHVRRHIRGLSRQHLMIHTIPTARGKERIERTDKLNGIRHISMPISKLRGQQFLLILEAEKERLIEVNLESQDPNWRTNMQEECENLFLSDRENEVAKKWNEQRKTALTKAIENMLLPALGQELRSELEFESRERLCDAYRQRFTQRIMRGPYSLRGAGLWQNIKDDGSEARGIKVLACVWDREMKVNRDATPVTCVLLSREGEYKETLELPFMQLPDEDVRKRDSCKLLLDFVKRQRPDVVCLGTNGRSSESLYQILITVLSVVPGMPNPVFIDDEPARIYQQSKRALTEFPEQNTLVKLAIGVGRLAHDPLCELANMLSDPRDFEQLMVHPLQDMLEATDRLKIADECTVDAVNAFGVDLNVATRNKHSSALLRFVSGLGPRKAKSIFDVLSASPQSIEFRLELHSQKLVGDKVYLSCAGFVRIDHGRLYKDIEDLKERTDLELLDNMMIHPDGGYDYGKKMAADALDIDTENLEQAEVQEANSKAVFGIIQDAEKLEELDLGLYAIQLEQTMGTKNMIVTLNDIKRELSTKWHDRQLPWKPLEKQELFQAIAGMQGRDLFVGSCEMAYYEGEPDEKNAYVQLDCQLRGRLQAEHCENATRQMPVLERFKFDEPLFYMCYKCEVSDSERGDRIMIDVTRCETQDEYGPGLQMSIEYECGILCDKFALSPYNKDETAKKGNGVKQRTILHPDFQNVTFNGARRYLEGDGAGSDFLIRPSSQGVDHLTVTIQFFEQVYLNVDILEMNRTAKSSIGSPLVIEDESYDDLDEVIYRFVHPLVDFAREVVVSHKAVAITCLLTASRL